MNVEFDIGQNKSLFRMTGELVRENCHTVVVKLPDYEFPILDRIIKRHKVRHNVRIAG